MAGQEANTNSETAAQTGFLFPASMIAQPPLQGGIFVQTGGTRGDCLSLATARGLALLVMKAKECAYSPNATFSSSRSLWQTTSSLVTSGSSRANFIHCPASQLFPSSL